VLKELQLGSSKVLIERGKNVYLAVIFVGEGSNKLRRIVSNLLVEIETEYGVILSKWGGDIRKLKGTEKILSVLIKNKEKSVENIGYNFEKNDNNYLSEPEHKLESLIQPPNTQLKQAIQNQVQNNTLTSKPILMAKSIKNNQNNNQCKDLLNCAKEQTGADQPGLPAWFNGGDGYHTLTRNYKNRLPFALHIKPIKQQFATLAINYNQLLKINKQAGIKRQELKHDLDINLKPIKILMPGRDKKFNLDPSRSLLMQLAELNNEK